MEPKFREQWLERRRDNLDFRLGDVRSFDEFHNSSLVLSHFSFQFLPEGDRQGLLRRVHDGLTEGGGLIIAEKVLANSAVIQDMFTSAYYDHKRKKFRPAAILDKERALRGQMRLWTRARLVTSLCEAGFQPENIESFWQNYLFVGMVAKKGGGTPPLMMRGQVRSRP